MNQQESSGKTYSFLGKVLVVILIASFITLLVLLAGQVITVLILVFIGLLFGILFRVLRDLVHHNTSLSKKISLAAVIVVFSSVTIGITFLLAPKVYKQGKKFYQDVPEKWEVIKNRISSYSWGRELIQENPHLRDFFEADTKEDGNEMTRSLQSLISKTVSVMGALLFIFVIAIYTAAEPEFYTRGLLYLFPRDRRKKVSAIMNKISIALQWWMVGQLCAMLLIGALTTLGLWLLGVPYPFLLGLFAGIMDLIPTLGPIISAVPAILVALTESPELAVYVTILFIIIQSLEGNFVTPLIHEKATAIGPVVIIAVQFMLYFLIGFLGVLIALPLLVCTVIVVKEVYIKGILNDPMENTTPSNIEGENIVDEK